MTPTTFTRTSRHLAGKVARAARQSLSHKAASSRAAQLPRLVSLAGAFTPGDA